MKKRAPAKPAAHPPFKDMVKAVIVALKERNGSFRQKITKYVLANYKGLGDEAAAKRHQDATKSWSEQWGLYCTPNELIGASGSFKLSKVAKATPKKKAASKKKPAAKKTAKKPAAKKPKTKKAKKTKDTKAKNPKAAKKPRVANKTCSQKVQGSQEGMSASQNQISLPKRGQRRQARLERRSKLQNGKFENVSPALLKHTQKQLF